MRLTVKRNATIFDPIPAGIRADGTTAYLKIASPEGGIHTCVSGMPGSGKTFSQIPILLTCGALQVDQVLIDPMKDAQSYMDVAGCLQMYEVDLQRCKQIINRVMTHVIPARTRFLAGEGLKQWSPKSELRFLRVHVEEAWRIADLKALTSLGLAIRSAGGQLTVSLQQPTFQYIDTALRNAMGNFQAFGIPDGDYATYGLPDDVLKAGADPAQWGNEYVGMHYLVSHGLTMHQKLLPVRSFADGVGEHTFANAAAKVGAALGPMCRVTAEALGDLWETRVAPLDLVQQLGPVVVGPVVGEALTSLVHPVTVPPVIKTPEPEKVDNPTNEDPDGYFAEFDEDDIEAAFRELIDSVPDDDNNDMITMTYEGEGFSIDLATDLDDAEDAEDEVRSPAIKRVIGDPPKDGVTRAEFDEVMEIRLQELLAAGQEIERGHFVYLAADCGWSPASAYKWLNRHPAIKKAKRGWVPRGPGDEEAA